MVSGKIFTGLKAVLEKAFKSSRVTLRNVLILVLVFGLERIFEKDVFKCPDTRHRLYGILFLFCPAFSLFVLTLLLNIKFWEALTGCRVSQFRLRWVIRRTSSMVFQALLPPGVWLVVALIQTNYYVCAKLGTKASAIQEATRNATASKIKEINIQINRKFSQAEAESHIIAWGFFSSLIALSFIVVCVRRCWFLQAEGILPDLEDYEKLEAEAAVEFFKNKIEEIANEEGEKYVAEKIESAKSKKPQSGYLEIEFLRKEVSKKYPRTTGDLSQPYRVDDKTSEVNGNNSHDNNRHIESSL